MTLCLNNGVKHQLGYDGYKFLDSLDGPASPVTAGRVAYRKLASYACAVALPFHLGDCSGAPLGTFAASLTRERERERDTIFHPPTGMQRQKSAKRDIYFHAGAISHSHNYERERERMNEIPFVSPPPRHAARALPPLNN